jgi:hypothetical protein
VGHEAPLGIAANTVGRLEEFRKLKMLIEWPISDAIMTTSSLA